MVWFLLAGVITLLVVLTSGPKCPYCGARTKPPLFTNHNQVQQCMRCGNEWDYADTSVYRNGED